MRYPNQIRQRQQIDALTGIKSSLDHIRSVIAIIYLLYVANDRKSFVRYSISDGTKIKIDPDLLTSIERMTGKDNLETIINNNPLLTKQYEPLYVGITLLMKLGHLKMEGKQSTAERTGGNRYPKQLYFANNIIILDLILNGFSDEVKYESLYAWLQNKTSSYNDFEDRVCMFLTTCTIFTKFKLRDNSNKDLFFQTEGIYSAIKESDDGVLFADSHEFVGPTRIYNNVLGEGLEPWVNINRNVLGFRNRTNPDAESMSNMISTTLNIFSVKDDAAIINNDEVNELNEVRYNTFGSAPLQKIFYGAPGTGKSNEIKILTGEGKDGIVFSKDFTFRTTFHPDFDYSTFVGAYKPIWDEGKGKIVYEFRPQTFLKAYVAAWTHPSENVALVIEEINRGNCAQIFGDIFQLLDRENDGLSKYPIESDIDMKYFLSRALSGEIVEPWAGIIPEDDKEKINEYYSKHYDDAFAKIKSGEILTLPKNLSILATMNTSDQSLFPMDSAFKRRWEWQYMPIKNANKNWVIHLADNYENIDWWEFLERINNVISDLTTSEDKQLGYFFCQPDEFVSPEPAPDAEPDLISAKRFVDKVIFYLWNDVFKDYAFDAKCCKDKDSKEVLFAKFYNEDGKSVNIEILKHFFETLTVENKPSLVEKIVPPTDVSGEEELSKTDVSSVDEEPNSTDKVSEEADLFTSATTGEK